MKKLFITLLAVLVFVMPFVALIAKRDAEREMFRPEVTPVRIVSAVKPQKAESVPEPTLTAQEQIAILNASYKQMWEREAQSKEPRYKLTEDERREIERIVASEGGYCEYRYQALVAQCILNGAERDNVRPSELFARGDFYITHNVEPTEVTKQAVSDVFDKGEFPTAERVMYYYNPDYGFSSAHESKRYVLTCCGCRFFTEW